MNVVAPSVGEWPSVPALPVPGQAVLIHVAPAPAREAARRELRNALRGTLAVWSGIPMGHLPLSETRSGPHWTGMLAGHPLDISFAYAGNEGWMGLARGGRIGIDVMPIEAIPEAESVARLYLGPDAAEAVRQAVDPIGAFATAWTDLEARLKCLKLGLVEWAPSQAEDMSKCNCQTFVFAGRLAVAVATAAAALQEVTDATALGCAAHNRVREDGFVVGLGADLVGGK